MLQRLFAVWLSIVALSSTVDGAVEGVSSALSWRRAGDGVALVLADREFAKLLPPRLHTVEGSPTAQHWTFEADRMRARFDEGREVQLELTRDGEAVRVRVAVSGDRGGVQQVVVPLILPIGLGQTRGTWEAGDATGRFPLAFEDMVLGQADADRLSVADGLGRKLTIRRAAGRGTAVFQDNRTWNWPVYECQIRVAADAAEVGEFVLEPSVDPTQAQPVVDALGQYMHLDWPGKPRGEADLLAADRAGASASASPSHFDRYGGLLGSGRRFRLEPAPFFRVERVGDRGVLVTPEGNVFFSLGVGALTRWGTYTPVDRGRERFAWLPDESDPRFSAAWIRLPSGKGFSFYIANGIRRFGDGHDSVWRNGIGERLRAWAFNTSGAFGEAAAGMPWTHWRLREAVLKAGRAIPGTAYEGSGSGIADVFEPGFAEALDQAVAAMITPHRDDPWLLGYFLNNEPFWDTLPAAVAGLDGGWAAKRRLVDELHAAYDGFDAFRRDFGTDAEGWDALANRPLWALNDTGRERLMAFGLAFLDRHLELLAASVRKHDPNHLLLGSRLLPRTADADPRFLGTFGRYCDVVSVNYYTFEGGFDAARVQRWVKAARVPLLLSEWSYGAPTRGHSGGPVTVADQRARAEAYRAYVLGAAAIPGVVGCHWFAYIDQPVTGRMNEGEWGERFNVGLVDVVDRPYVELTQAARAAHHAAYDRVIQSLPEDR